MIYILIAVLFLICPIHISLNSYFLLGEKKGVFAVKLYGFLSIFGGYISLDPTALSVHISEKKAMVLPYKSLFEIKKSLRPFKGYNVINVAVYLDGKSKNSLAAMFYLSRIFEIVFYPILYTKKPYIKFIGELDKSKTNIDGVGIKISVLLNIITLIVSIIKILLGKFIDYAKKRKQNKLGY